MARRPSREPDLTPAQVAKALGYGDVGAFLDRAETYHRLGLRPDPITGLYDPEGFDRWRRLRNSELFPEIVALTPPTGARHAADVVNQRLARLVG